MFIIDTGYITRSDVFDIFSSAQGGYNLFITVFLGILALAAALFGYVIPKKNVKELEDFENRIVKDIESYKDGINTKVTALEKLVDANIKDVKTYKAEILTFKDNLNVIVEDLVKEKLKETYALINENNKINLKRLEYHQKSHLNLTQGIVFALNQQFRESVEIYLRAVNNAVKSNQGDIIESVISNLINNKKNYIGIDQNTISPDIGFTLIDYLKKIEENLDNNESLRIIYKNFKTTLLDILNTGTHPQGRD